MFKNLFINLFLPKFHQKQIFFSKLSSSHFAILETTLLRGYPKLGLKFSSSRNTLQQFGEKYELKRLSCHVIIKYVVLNTSQITMKKWGLRPLTEDTLYGGSCEMLYDQKVQKMHVLMWWFYLL